MRRYRVTVRKQIGLDDVWAERCHHFDRWWQAFRYARAMRGAGYATTRVRVR